MLHLPNFMMVALDPFAQVFWGTTTWYRAQELVVGALLATGKRTVRPVLRVLGRSAETNDARYHEVPGRAVWSGLAVSALPGCCSRPLSQTNH